MENLRYQVGQKFCDIYSLKNILIRKWDKVLKFDVLDTEFNSLQTHANFNLRLLVKKYLLVNVCRLLSNNYFPRDLLNDRKILSEF